ncbi:hypothetical protein COO05_31935, partial [Bacillus toyonensis]
MKKRRYFDKTGRAEKDTDFTHGNGDNSHTFPHDHTIDWSKGYFDRSKHSSSTKFQGWVFEEEIWYYFNSSSQIVTGWQQISGTWYYLNGSGAMLTGW